VYTIVTANMKPAVLLNINRQPDSNTVKVANEVHAEVALLKQSLPPGITLTPFYFQSVLEARAFDNIYQHFDELSDHFVQPSALAILSNLIYWMVLFLIACEKAGSMAVIAFGLIASAVCALLGPLFVPFFIVPKLDWLFWGWFKSFIQYSFIPVVAVAFLMVFERFIFRYVSTLPPTITEAEYGVYALQAIAVVITFCTGILLVPSLTTSIFSGQGGQASFGLSRFMRR
jgi:type IV secretory pathway VirB6-like protein